MTNPLQEDNGLIEIHKVCVEMYGIWRQTPCHDLGIDGQIEFLEAETSISTGHIIAVQCKSGPSFFTNQDDDFVKFYPKEKPISKSNALRMSTHPPGHVVMAAWRQSRRKQGGFME